MSGIREYPERRLEAQRVVFGHDPGGDDAGELEGLELARVATFRVANHECAVRQSLLHVEPTAKFLVYPGLHAAE